MKNNIKLLLVAMLCVCTLLAACGKTENTASVTEAKTDEVAAQVDEKKTDKPITLKVGSQDTADSIAGQLLTQFKEDVETQSEGNITVDLYFSSTLGSLADMMEGVSMGTIDMATVGIPSLQTYCSDMVIYDNYFVGNADEFLRIWNSDVGRQVINELKEEAGISVIAYNLCGVGRIEYWTNRDYDSLASLKNANLRSNGTSTVNIAAESFGAVAVTVSNAEQFNAMQTGMLDAMSLDAANMIDQGFLQKGMYELDIVDNFMGSGLIISDKTLEKMSEQQKDIIMNCAALYSKNSEDSYEAKMQKTAESLEEFEIVKCSISESDIAEIRTLVKTALNEYYAKLCSPDVLAQASELLGK